MNSDERREADCQCNLAEVFAWADLIAAFHDRNGRDPDATEHADILAVARQMASAGQNLN